MDRKADTHIRVTEDTWAALNARKRPGDSFDDVIQRLLEEGDEAEDSGSEKYAHATPQQFDLNDTAGDEDLQETLEELRD
jgi:transcriptional regulator